MVGLMAIRRYSKSYYFSVTDKYLKGIMSQTCSNIYIVAFEKPSKIKQIARINLSLLR